ncbi:N-formylglutamate amidohydrolase [Devosia crocina]|nr:N-formylglutamate amidohydrolase [Devosia crocina]
MAPSNTDTGTAQNLSIFPAPTDLWSVHRAVSPLIGTAIHNGHHVRPELVEQMALGEAGRLREEDPFTEFTIRDVPNRVVFHRSRFEVDLNRARDGAVYLTPDQAWGLDIWRRQPEPALVERSLRAHDGYYAMLEAMLSGIAADHGQFVLLDIHSYNHRRNGADAAPTPAEQAPVVNIGTFSMDRARWAHVLDPFIESLRSTSFMGRPMDVRENVAFAGKGEQTRFVHERFPRSGCAIAIEFKKVFMDEWTGAPDPGALLALRRMIAASLPVLLESLEAHA